MAGTDVIPNGGLIIAQELTSDKREDIKSARYSEENKFWRQRILETQNALPIPNVLQEFATEENSRQFDRLWYECQVDPNLCVQNPIYYFPYEYFDNIGRIAGSRLGFVEVPDLPIEDPDLKSYQEAILLGHELCHDKAPYKMFHVKEGDRRDDRTGLFYREEGDLLEEGIALRSQRDGTTETARKMFPKGAEQFDKIANRLASEGKIDLSKGTLVIKVLKENGDFSCIFQSMVPAQLVDLLAENIPNFDKLAERARICHETLALAKAIDSKFGKGTYKRLVTTNQMDAEEVLNDLRSKVE